MIGIHSSLQMTSNYKEDSPVYLGLYCNGEEVVILDMHNRGGNQNNSNNTQNSIVYYGDEVVVLTKEDPPRRGGEDGDGMKQKSDAVSSTPSGLVFYSLLFCLFYVCLFYNP